MDQQYWYDDHQMQQNFSNNTDKKRGGGRVSIMTLIICMLLTGLLGGAAGGLLSKAGQAPASISEAQLASDAKSANDEPSQPAALDSQQSITPDGLVNAESAKQYTKKQIIELCAPSVVGIDVEGEASWYGRSTLLSGSGSGIIISADGYIITNNHVVSGSNTIKVYLHDDEEYDATLIATDATTDLAVIKIEATGLQPSKLGDSDQLAVGDDVIAIGNPLGELRGSATSGMISAVSRTITIEDQKMHLLQTDAAINPGNSGGGLFNDKGELIGVVNAKVASAQIEGLGFAIPINDAKTVISDLMDYGYVSGRAYLGVYTQDVAYRSNSSSDGRGDSSGNNGFDDFFGGIFRDGQQAMETRVTVVDLVPGSAAVQAGIQKEDLILAVDDQEIFTGTQLASAISEYKAGDVATIKIQRGNDTLSLSVTFGEYIPDAQS